MDPDLEDLAEALDSASWTTQASALRELAREGTSLGNRSVAEVLDPRLPDLASAEKWEVRRSVARLLGVVRTERTAPILARLREDRNAGVAQAAADSIERWARADRHSQERDRREGDLSATMARLRVEDPQRADQIEELAFAYAAAVVGGVGHDLGKVITQLSGLASSVERRGPPEDLSERLVRLASFLSALAADSADFVSRSQSPRVRTQVLRCVSNVLSDHQAALEGIEVVVRVGSGLYVLAPAAELERALGNLVRNASESFAKDPRQITVRAYETAAEELGAPTLALEVEDTGMGMEDPEWCLVPFRSTKKKRRASATPHTGLGLAIVRRLVERVCGGRLEIESVLDQGTTVRVLLPLAGDP